MPLVTMPDGANVSFPDDMPPEQIKGLIASKFPHVVEDSGFSENRLNKVTGTIDRFKSGAIGPTQAGFQVLGQGLGVINDKISEAIPETVKDAVSSVYTLNRDYNPLVSPSIRALEQAGGMAGNAYNDFSKNNPNAAANLDAAGNLIGVASLIVPGPRAIGTAANAAPAVGKLALGGGKAVARPIAGGVGNLAAGAAARSGEALTDASSLMKGNAGGLYDQMRQAGATLNQQSANNLLNSIDSAVASKQFIPALNPKTLAIVEHIKDAAAKGDLGIDELDQYRRLLGRIGQTEDGVSAGTVRAAIDNHVNSLSPVDLSNGSTNAINLLNQGRKKYQQASKFDAVADILVKADGDPNRIKSGLTRLLNNKNKTRGFSPQEMQLLKDAARSSVPEKVLKMLGKFGIDLGTSLTPGNTVAPLVGGALTGGVLPVGGTIARQGQKYLARGKAEKLLRTIEN